MTYYLFISLGHNSSAVLATHTGHVLIGYEEERLTRVKSDSRFPILSIAMILRHIPKNEITKVYFSHWFDRDLLSICQNKESHAKKYLEGCICSIIDGVKRVVIVSATQDIYLALPYDEPQWPDKTHHSCHAYAALHFSDFVDNYLITVADGFGTRQEVFSAYEPERNNSDSLKCKYKAFGYDSSLGLLYQRATQFCGMKKHQDEYKFLGYRSRFINTYEEMSEEAKHDFNKIVNKIGDSLAYRLFVKDQRSKKPELEENEIIDISSLTEANTRFDNQLTLIINSIDSEIKHDSEVSREIIGEALQRILKIVYGYYLTEFLDLEDRDFYVFTGGVHYNVDLNYFISQTILRHNPAAHIHFHPICGDQGAAVGMIGAHRIIWKDLLIGARFINHEEVKALANVSGVPGFYYLHDCGVDEAVESIMISILAGRIVNLVNFNFGMEFGPRALCHTSTLALPTPVNAEFINRLNERNSVMPYAPVILEENLPDLFVQSDVDAHKNASVLNSYEYMISLMEINRTIWDPKEGLIHKYGGVVHRALDEQYGPGHVSYTARPQVISQRPQASTYLIRKLLECLDEKGIKCLINTSFNNHGKPIVYSAGDAVSDHAHNLEMSQDLNVTVELFIVS